MYIVLVGSQKERDHYEDQGLDGRMASVWILGTLAERDADLVASGYGQVVEHGDQPSVSPTTELVV